MLDSRKPQQRIASTSSHSLTKTFQLKKAAQKWVLQNSKEFSSSEDSASKSSSEDSSTSSLEETDPGPSPKKEPKRTPVALSGKDPSTKKKGELFKVDMERKTNRSLQEALPPPGLPRKCHEDMVK